MKRQNLGRMEHKKGQKGTMKKAAAAMVMAALALFLAGCGTSGQSQASASGTSGQSQASASGTSGQSQTNTAGTQAAGQTNTAGTQAAGTGAETQAESQTTTSGSASGTDTEAGSKTQSGEGNILIAYFSVMETDGVDTVGGASRVAVDGEVMGNNEYVAKIIQQETGGDLFAIETVQDYPTIHEPLLEFAYNEKAENARPELSSQIENLDQYDTIFLGYPNWNADLPMPLYTFLEEYDFSGKTIIPFTTHGGSGFSRTISTIESLQPGAEVLEDGLSISRNSVSGAAGAVADWVRSLGLASR